MRRDARRHAVIVALAVSMAAACVATRPVQTEPGKHDNLAELWNEPEPNRDLFWGIGGPTLAPDPGDTYSVVKVKQGGFSHGLTVRDSADRKWSAKFPPEAPTEVVASRLLWGVGYHQPPIYYVGRWNAQGAPDPNPQLPARFRQSKPKVNGVALGDDANWSYYRNPFVGTAAMNGLLVLQVMLCNSDLKDEQNFIYRLKEPLEGASRWYVARDLGESFGSTGTFEPPRGDIKAFEQTPFIKGMASQYVRFEWRGRHGVLIDRMTVADVRWICTRLQGLSDKQWHDAFAAGGYAPVLADRFIRRMKQKIHEGLSVGGGAATAGGAAR